MPKPTPIAGDALAYHPSSDDPFATSSAPLAAVISAVRPAGYVDVTVTDAGGVTHARAALPLIGDGEEPPRFGAYCTWA